MDHLKCVIESVDAKTRKYAPRDVKSRVLAIDASVDVFWLTLLGNREVVRRALGDCLWWSVVLVGPSMLLHVGGADSISSCACNWGYVASEQTRIEV